MISAQEFYRGAVRAPRKDAILRTCPKCSKQTTGEYCGCGFWMELVNYHPIPSSRVEYGLFAVKIVEGELVAFVSVQTAKDKGYFTLWQDEYLTIRLTEDDVNDVVSELKNNKWKQALKIVRRLLPTRRI